MQTNFTSTMICTQIVWLQQYLVIFCFYRFRKRRRFSIQPSLTVFFYVWPPIIPKLLDRFEWFFFYMNEYHLPVISFQFLKDWLSIWPVINFSVLIWFLFLICTYIKESSRTVILFRCQKLISYYSVTVPMITKNFLPSRRSINHLYFFAYFIFY